MKNKELQIMLRLRTNARETLTRMSRKTGIPVSTIYERLKSFEDDVITKHTSLLNFRKLGYELRMTMLIKSKQGKLPDLQSYFEGNAQVNTIFRVNNGFDFFIEALFKNMSEVQRFLDGVDRLGVKQRKEFYVLEELRREAFLTSQAHLELLKPFS